MKALDVEGFARRARVTSSPSMLGKSEIDDADSGRRVSRDIQRSPASGSYHHQTRRTTAHG